MFSEGLGEGNDSVDQRRLVQSASWSFAMMDYDKILEHLGEWGRWNVTNQLLIWVGPFISGFMVLVYSFTGTNIGLPIFWNKYIFLLQDFNLTSTGARYQPVMTECPPPLFLT